MKISELNNIIAAKSAEIHHIESALNNLKVVCSLQSKDQKSEPLAKTNQMIQDLYLRVEDLKVEIASYNKELKRLKQQENDALVFSYGYL